MDMSLASFYTWLNSFILLGYWILVVATTLRIVTNRRPTTFVVAWMLIIYILPVLGIITRFFNHLGRVQKN